MAARLLAVVALAVTAWSAAPRPIPATSADAAVFRAAALALGTRAPAAVEHWLARQPAVRAARVGSDGRTLTIHFADGQRAAILPPIRPMELIVHAGGFGRCSAMPGRAAAGCTRAPGLTGRRRQTADALPPYTGALPGRTAGFRADNSPGSAAPQAAVIEPFATELGLSPSTFDPVVSYLHGAGFAVDTAYDDQVTLATMATLANYNVVYVLSHSGVEDDGTGLLATAQEAPCKPYSSPDGTVQAVGVWGSTACYLAITPAFISKLPVPFPADSIVFLNGCTLLTSHPFWVALANRGAGVMLSWTGDAQGRDDFLTAQAFFGEMVTGMSVAGAIDTLTANGFGRSSYQGKVAVLGYRGDGTITLKRAAAAIPPSVPPTLIPTDTPPPTSTPVPTATPKPLPPTPTPPATATTIPLPTDAPPLPPLLSAPPSAVPGTRVRIGVTHAAPGSTAQLLVTYPSGSTVRQTQTADGAGTIQFTYDQQSAQITRTDRIAQVRVSGQGATGPFDVTGSYRIGYGPVDVYIRPLHPAPRSTIAIWTHSRGRTAVRLRIRSEGRMLRSVQIRGRRWSSLLYRLPSSVRAGQQVLVAARVGGGTGYDLAIARVTVR